MRVPLIDLRAQYETIRSDVEAVIRRIFESQRFVLGPEGEALEAGIAKLSGSKHAIGCASGSDAIMLAIAAVMEARGVRPFAPYLGSAGRRDGSSPGMKASDLPEVVTVPFTFFASAGSVVHAGAVPRFVDIEPEAYGMDAGAVPGAITARTVAVLPVHLFGQPCDLAEVLRASGSVPVIEDNAQAIGAMYGPPGRRRGAGSIGLAGSLSFFPTKNLGAAGDAGMVLTDDDLLAERLRKIRVHGGQQMYHHETVGWNSRLDELQAGVLNVKLSRLESWSQARREHAGRYDALLAEAGLVSRGLVLPPVRKPDRTHIFHQYVVRVPGDGSGRDRDGLRQRLTGAGIGSGVYYPVPLHLQDCFRELGYARGDFPVSEKAAGEVLALPVYPELSADQQALVVREIASYFGLA